MTFRGSARVNSPISPHVGYGADSSFLMISRFICDCSLGAGFRSMPTLTPVLSSELVGKTPCSPFHQPEAK